MPTPQFLLLTAGGRGSRMRAVDPDLPKELLRVRGKPAIQYAIDEGIAAGITEIIIDSSPEKDQLRRYIEDPSYARNLFPTKADDIASSLNRCRFSFVYQESPTGEIDAIRLAEPLIDDGAFAIIYPDDIHFPLGAALLKRRPGSKNLAVRTGIIGGLCTGYAFRFMRRVSLPEESAARGNCVCAPVGSETPGRLAGHR